MPTPTHYASMPVPSLCFPCAHVPVESCFTEFDWPEAHALRQSLSVSNVGVVFRSYGGLQLLVDGLSGLSDVRAPQVGSCHTRHERRKLFSSPGRHGKSLTFSELTTDLLA